MHIKPLHDKVIVKAQTKESTTDSGIILPDTVDQGRPEQGEVVAVGPGKILQDGSRAPMSVEVGQTVLFKKYSPDEIKVKDEEYLVIADQDIIGIVN